MARNNKPHDVFRLIDMKGGDKTLCWPFLGGLNSEGRPYIQIDGKKHLAYRVTYELTFGVKLGDQMLLHQCDNEICCNPWHGKPGEHQQNMNEMKERERHGMPHHTVRMIRKMISGGLSDQAIADLTKIGRKAIYDIRNNNNYAHVKDEENDHQT